MFLDASSVSICCLCWCVSGGVDTAAGGEEEDQEGLQTSPAPFPVEPSPQQPSPEQHILQWCQVEQYVVHCECREKLCLLDYRTAPKTRMLRVPSEPRTIKLRRVLSILLRGLCVVWPHLFTLWVKGQLRSWHDPGYCRVSGAEGFVSAQFFFF